MQKDGSGNVTGYVDTGTDKQVDSDGNTVFERSYTFNFDTSYNLTSGTETENGITRTFGANWEITGETANVLDSSGNPNAGFTVVSQSDLDVLPTALKAASGSTYQSTKTDGSDVEATYYDAAGNVLGYSNSYSNNDGSSTKTFEDLQYNWLGDTVNDPANGFSSSFFKSEIKDSSGNVTGHREIGTSKEVDSKGNTVFERSFTFNYDTSYNLTSGTETENGITRTYGQNWELVSEITDTSSLPTLREISKKKKSTTST